MTRTWRRSSSASQTATREVLYKTSKSKVKNTVASLSKLTNTLRTETMHFETVHVQDASRTATFYVDCGCGLLCAVAIDAMFEGEAAVVEGSMIGTLIDLDALHTAKSVSDALAIVAINSSKCSQLTAVHGNNELILERSGVRIFGDVPTPPLSLDALPAVALQHILLFGSGLRLASRLRSASHTLCDTLQLHTRRAGDLAVRTCGQPGPGSADANIVRWDASSRSLTKTGRPGHAMVVFAEHLFHISAVLEFHLTSLPAIGGVTYGVMRMSEISEVGYRAWFDGCGRAHVGQHVNGGDERAGVGVVPCGERVCEGDRVGVLYDARSMAFAMLLNGKLSTPLLRLKRPWAGSPGYRFFLRFDCIPGLQVQLVNDGGGLDAPALVRQPPSPPRPLAHDAPTVLVREVGPDSRMWGVCLPPDATVGALKTALEPLLHVDGVQMQLRAECRDLKAARAARITKDEARLRQLPGGIVMSNDSEPLAAFGIRAEPNGGQLVDVYVNVPLIIG